MCKVRHFFTKKQKVALYHARKGICLVTLNTAGTSLSAGDACLIAYNCVVFRLFENVSQAAEYA